ncbi:hypothetical protein EOI86_17500 [Hwanghaeella grinnelliae]|uniref:DUF6468 domain-containing protein n=1 Tax=Hwanghaeella grinnelliae TaxID=2500179 RepID=A0A437QJH6_9PROT|nr:DUF6468 domain-containing protein [Hwanghaeella grinnelliae]RVU34653.1 hypothetical protein EOI86_17500 [Hwanghaeella grinnelliae]
MILPELSLVLDILIACLLVAVIVYALRLNKSLSVLQQSKSELEKMLKSFGDSTEKAEQAIQRVKEASTQNRDSLNKLLSEAETLREDLAYMIERGNSLADKLEGGIAQHRPGTERDGSAVGEQDGDIETAMRAARQAASAPGKESRKALAVKPEDRARGGTAKSTLPATTGAEGGTEQGKDNTGKAKSKSALLRALQGMR